MDSAPAPSPSTPPPTPPSTPRPLPAPRPAHEVGTWDRRARVLVSIAFAVAAMVLPLHVTWGRLGALVAFVGFLATLWGFGDRERRAPGRVLLLLAAIGTIGGSFAFANPWGGIDDSHWPWEYWMGPRRWVDRIDLLLWALVAILTMWAAWSRRTGVVVAVLAAALLLAARGFADQGALILIRVGRVNLIWMVAAGALGGALVHLSGPSRVGRGAARAIAGLAALTIFAVYAGWFPDPDRPDRSSIAIHAAELPQIFDDAFRGAESSRKHVLSSRKAALMMGFPLLALGATLLLAAFVALLPGKRHGRVTRWVSAVALALLLSTWFVPVRAEFLFASDLVGTAATQSILRIVIDAVMRAGLVLFLALAGGVAALLGRRPAEPPALPNQVGRRPGGWLRVLYGLTAVFGLWLLWASLRPETGLVVHATLREALTAGSWNAGTALAVMLLLFVVVPIVVPLLRHRPTRVFLSLTTALIGFTALTPGRNWIGGIQNYVVPAVAAVAAVAAGHIDRTTTRGGLARAVAGSGAVFVLIALLYPIAVETQIGLGGSVHAPYESALVDNLIGPLRNAPSGAWAFEFVTHPLAWLVIGLTLVAVFVFVSVLTGRGPRGWGWAARWSWIAGVLGAWLVFVVVGTLRGGAESLAVWATWAASGLREWSIPTFLLWFAAVSELAGRSEAGLGVGSPGRAASATPAS